MSFTFFQWKANQKYSNACENDIKFKFQRVQKVLPEQSFVPVIIFHAVGTELSCCLNLCGPQSPRYLVSLSLQKMLTAPNLCPSVGAYASSHFSDRM